jgi:hypothetical protein
MSELKDMVDNVYIESFAREIIDNYINQKGYEPLPDEKVDKIIAFSQKLINLFDVKSEDAIATKSVEDKLKLDAFLTRLLDAIISLLSYIVMCKTEEAKLHMDIKNLKEKLK